MKRILGSVIHILLVIGTLLLCTSKLNGSDELGSFMKPLEKVEMIPYRLVPSGDVHCAISIEIIEPISMVSIPHRYEEEIEEVILDRITFEVTNPFAENEIFYIDGKPYFLLRVPYTGVKW